MQTVITGMPYTRSAEIIAVLFPNQKILDIRKEIPFFPTSSLLDYTRAPKETKVIDVVMDQYKIAQEQANQYSLKLQQITDKKIIHGWFTDFFAQGLSVGNECRLLLHLFDPNQIPKPKTLIHLTSSPQTIQKRSMQHSSEHNCISKQTIHALNDSYRLVYNMAHQEHSIHTIVDEGNIDSVIEQCQRIVDKPTPELRSQAEIYQFLDANYTKYLKKKVCIPPHLRL